MNHAIRIFLCALVGLIACRSVVADGPLFTNDIIVENANPDVILRNTNGENWAIEIDEPANDAFSIARNNGSTHVFVLANGAPANSLYVDFFGRIGIGTSSPQTELDLHDTGGSETTITMQDPGNSTGRWGIVVNQSDFFLQRRFSGGIRRPFFISHDAPANSFRVFNDGNMQIAGPTLFVNRAAGAVGIGTQLPAASLHVADDSGTAGILVEEVSPSVQKRSLLELSNNGPPQLLFTDTSVATRWELNPNPNGNFIINGIGLGGTEFTLTGGSGNLRISGDMRADDFIVTSARDSKEGFQEIEPREVLRKVVELPITQWSFKDNPAKRHLGPVAEDFKQTFGLGGEEKRISMIDSNGVALAAIQGLDARQDDRFEETTNIIAELKAEKDAEIATLKSELAELKTIVRELMASK